VTTGSPAPASHAYAVRDTSRTALVLLALALAFRLVYAATTGIVQDEAYYWQWSRHLDLGYFDAGPGIALAIRAGTLLLGDTPLGLRFVPILLGGASGWLAYLTARRWLDGRAALWALLFTLTAPLLAAGSILATYDLPQIFFWAAALYALTRTLQEDRAGGWYAVGALFGLGMLCKPTMALFAPGVLLLLALSPAYRKWLVTPHPYLAMGVGVLVFSPVIVWNARHEYLNFAHTLGRGSRGSSDSRPFQHFDDFLGGQALAVGLGAFLAEMYLVVRLFRARGTDAERFVLAFTAPTFLLCFALATRAKLEINWPVAMHVTGLMAVGALFGGAWERGGWRRPLLVANFALSLVMIAVALFPGVVPALAGPVPARPTFEKPLESYGWPTLTEEVEKARRALAAEGDTPVFPASFTYRTASILAFYLPGQPEVAKLQLPTTRLDQYRFWTRPEELIGQNAVVAVDTDVDKSEAFLRQCFGRVERRPVLRLTREGFTGTVKEWHLFVCHDFRGYPPQP